jgi:hypothetical protein
MCKSNLMTLKGKINLKLTNVMVTYAKKMRLVCCEQNIISVGRKIC